MVQDLTFLDEMVTDSTAEVRSAPYSSRQDVPLVSKLTALSRLLPYLLITGLCLPVQVLLHRVSSPVVWERFCRWYHARAVTALGVKIIEVGIQSKAKPTLFVSNHNSYFDIEVLGAKILGTFVAMADVADWPLFGLLSKLQDTVFIDRKVGTIAEQQRQITKRFDRKQNLIIFPEGSSYTGTHTLPFKSSLLAVAKHEVEQQPVTIQPVSVTFAKLDGLPIARSLRSYYGWYGHSPIVPHITGAAGLGKLTMVVEWHPPKTIKDFAGNRKKLAAYCEDSILAGMARARST